MFCLFSCILKQLNINCYGSVLTFCFGDVNCCVLRFANCVKQTITFLSGLLCSLIVSKKNYFIDWLFTALCSMLHYCFGKCSSHCQQALVPSAEVLLFVEASLCFFDGRYIKAKHHLFWCYWVCVCPPHTHFPVVKVTFENSSASNNFLYEGLGQLYIDSLLSAQRHLAKKFAKTCLNRVRRSFESDVSLCCWNMVTVKAESPGCWQRRDYSVANFRLLL